MREYQKIILHSEEDVMFLMDNGWYYLVCPRLDKIGAFKHPMFYTKFNPYAIYGDDIPDEVRRKAEFDLQTKSVVDAISYEKIDETKQNTWKLL